MTRKITRRAAVTSALALGTATIGSKAAFAGILGNLIGLPSLRPGPRTPVDDLKDHVKREARVETLGPVLAAHIRAGKADAMRGTVSPLPSHVRQAMLSYFPADLVDRARWRTGFGSFTVQAGSIQLGGKDAIVLDDIMIFKATGDLDNLKLVAHELGHVYQYWQWGIDDFAKRYVRDFGAVEADAERLAINWDSGATWPAVVAPVPSSPASRAIERPYRNGNGAWVLVQ